MCDELKANFDTLLREYPSGMSVNTLIMAKNFGIKQDYVVVGNGAAEIIKSLMENSELKTGVTFPTFEEYPNRNKENIIEFHPTNHNFQYTVQDLIDFYNNKPINQLLLINPDNPSENFIPIDQIYKLLEWCTLRNVRLVLDESFVDFSTPALQNSFLSNEKLELYPNLVVIKSISKSYGVPGLRLGLAASADKNIILSL